jgi:molybdopterin-containing oxidoreductase family iron-sulfur binding subunit
MTPEPGRRDFLKLTGLGAAAALAACERLPVRHALPYLVPPEEITPGVSAHYAGTCTACPAACGLLATVRDGRPIKLEGRPDHPLSRGGLCAVGQADLRGLYDPGRARVPRLGGRVATWAELDAAVRDGLAEVRGAGRDVAVLSATLTSPSARAAVQAFLQPLGGTLVEHDPGPESCPAWLEAYELLDGRPLLPALELEQADLLVVLAADLFGAGIDPVTHTAAWSARRRAAPQRGLARHVQIEGSLSLTGAAADERWLATAAERRLLALLLLKHVAGRSAVELGERLKGLPALPALEARVTALGEQLLARRGTSLVVSGDNDLPTQVAVALLNRLLGNEGKTLDLARPSLVRRGLDRGLAALLDGLAAGRIGALFVHGLDPVEQLPDGEGFRALLAKLPLSVMVGERPNATAAACRLLAAAHHGLESWGDFEPRAGTLSLQQPMVRPLFETRQAGESFLRWAGATEGDYRAFLRERWRREVLGGPGDFEARWNAAVAAGGAPAPPPAADPAPGRPTPPAEALASALAGRELAPSSDGLEAELIAEVALRDGSRAHVPWLRELPDPLTRVSWAACVRVAPERAAELGLTDGDVLEVTVGGRSVSLPARVLPGQHPRVLGLPVGYGRSDGQPGDARLNAYHVATLEHGRVVRAGLAAGQRRTGQRVELPFMQIEMEAHGRPLVPEVASHEEHVHAAHHPMGRDLWPQRPQTGPRWHMVIDLDACTGCSGCVVACQAENNIAVVGSDEMRRQRDMHWLRIDRYFEGQGEATRVKFQPMLCAQCGHAPCETVCPVAATVHSEDGLNQQVYNRCVGTRYCANNCPYKVRRFNWFGNEVQEPVERLVLNPDVVVRSRGVMEKCTFCIQRVQAARLAARAEGDPAGPAAQTACQQSCPARAITFGDGSDAQGPLAPLRAKPRAFQVLAELGVEPSVTYLARVRAGEKHGEHA